MARILVIEYHELVNQLLCDALDAVGHTTDAVPTKAAAEALLGPNSYAPTVCDVLLPDGSGRDVAARAAGFGIKTILLSDDPDELAAELDAVAQLKKPFRIAELYALIEKYLGR
jgi:DNA-binding response OmpR family regulator